MSLFNIDTLKASKQLQASGFNENQAEAVINILALSVNTDDLVTKDEFKYEISEVRKDINEVKAELKQDIAEVRQEIAAVRTELKQDIAEVRQEIAEVKAELKQEIMEVKTELKIETKALRDKIDVEILKLQNSLFKLIGGGFVASIGVMLTAMRLMLN